MVNFVGISLTIFSIFASFCIIDYFMYIGELIRKKSGICGILGYGLVIMFVALFGFVFCTNAIGLFYQLNLIK